MAFSRAMNAVSFSGPITLADLRRVRDEILRIAERHGAKNISVFGSVARGEATAGSDVDFLLELERGRSLFDLSGFKIDLEDFLGREVHVVTPGAVHPRMKERIYAEAQPL
jgi:uncharacterized protein